MDTIHNKTYEVLIAAECKNPFISPIAIFTPLSTVDDFEGKE